MSSPSTSRVSSAAESIDSSSPVCQVGEPWIPRSEELPNSPWYEEKSSTLKLSDIDIIKEKGGTMGKFEVVIPQPDERTHRPPPGFHTFYMNQIEMGLRFPIPRFIAVFCRHIQLSPSQLASNSYSFLLALAVLLSYHDIPLIPYVLMQLVQAVAWGGEMVKRLTKAHQKMNASRDQFDKAMEEGAVKAQREALEAQLVVEREAHEAEKAARELLEAELDEVKVRETQEAERLKIEGKEEFLKSPEFDTLLGKKAGGYFKNGFLGCLAQWRANGYPEEEHPASFLNVQQAIAEMADEEEVQEEEEDEDEEGEEGGDGSDATPPSSPFS
ncbi:hypothetical protein F511_30832 [Dorcoceras hygrometricum]|uniref:Uncharacterized protein n=1 Tax=Dorcoceras hygrometricum TaxID=472368 RepID=A0A2Z7AKK0_9LAMI|nr:hypothetical protein F511_30832 [Dorcoceras hygrometricum]